MPIWQRIRINLIPQYFAFSFFLFSVSFGRIHNVDILPTIDLGPLSITYVSAKSLIGIAVILTVMILWKRLEDVVSKRKTLIIAAGLCVLGYLLIYVTSALPHPLSPERNTAVVLFGNLLVWVGTQLLYCGMAKYFVSGSSRTAGIVTGFVLAMVAGAISLLLPILIQQMFGVLSIVSLCAMLLKTPSPNSTDRPDPLPLTGKELHHVGAFCSFVLIFALATSFSRNVYLSVIDEKGVAFPLGVLLSLAIACAVLSLTAKSYNKFNVIALYRAVFLFFIISFCATPLFLHDYELVYSMQLVADMMFHCVSFIMVYKCCLRTGWSAVFLYSATRLLRVLGSLIVMRIGRTTGLTPDSIIPVIMVFIIGFAIIYTVVFTEKTVWRFTEQKRPDSEAEARAGKVDAISASFALSPREKEVLSMLCQGRNTPFIAEELFISTRTVDVHIRNIYKKMGVHSRQELIDYYNSMKL